MVDDDDPTERLPGGKPQAKKADRSDQAETEPSSGPSSDVRLAAEDTLPAPSMPQPVAKRAPSDSPHHLNLSAGDQVDDFEVIEVLGRGAFGVVYLARQKSLDRRVALKITANEGSEGRTMARLEHDHVVQVFSESVDETGTLRLLCMQLVPGASLEAAIREVHQLAQQRGGWSGGDYLAAIDGRSKVSDVFDPSALRDRQLLAEANDVETAAWVGARLAEAINFAHANGVLHRDIKPANVLINQYGRPMLADFNISFRSVAEGAEGDEGDTTFGGTLAFMAPEHLEAFDHSSGVKPDEVDERSDIYSLAMVVYELLTGKPPFTSPKRDVSRTHYVGVLARWRRSAPAPIEAGPPCARKVLEHTIAKSLSPAKPDRHQTGEQFAAALDGCRRLASVERVAPETSWFTKSAIRHPLLWSVLLIFLPQVIGSVVNISYNRLQIVGLLTEAQQTTFWHLVNGYNAIVYPLAVAALVYLIRPVFSVWKSLESPYRLPAEQVRSARLAAVRLPVWVLIIAAIGWLPGGFLFPALLNYLEGPVDGHVFVHFLISFAFSGLIAVAYSFCGMQYLVLRVLYPRLWTDATDFQFIASQELTGTNWRIWFIEAAAYVVPFVANMSFVLLVSEGGAIPLQTLIVSLAFLGLAGTAVVRVATGAMAKTQTVLTGRG